MGGTVGLAASWGRIRCSNRGTVTDSYATGSVTGKFSNIGGLVGLSYNTVTASYATGSVTGRDNVGGLVGWIFNNGTVTGSYATGSVTGRREIGGFVGRNLGTVTSSYWDMELSGNAILRTEGSASPRPRCTIRTVLWVLILPGPLLREAIPRFFLCGCPPYWDDERFPHLRGVSKNGQILSVPRVVVMPGSAPFLLEHTLLPPTISEQAPAFSGDDDAVATINASTGIITLAAGVTGGAVTITVRRDGNEDYAPISVSQTLVVKPFVEGTGISENPWQIRTPAQLNTIRGEYLDDHIMLTTDLDFSEYTYEDPEKGWLPIGHDTDASSNGHQGTPFTGSFDGNDHVIRNLRIDREGRGLRGLVWESR